MCGPMQLFSTTFSFFSAFEHSFLKLLGCVVLPCENHREWGVCFECESEEST